MKKGTWVLIGIVAVVAIGIIIRVVKPPVLVEEVPMIKIGIIGPMKFLGGQH